MMIRFLVSAVLTVACLASRAHSAPDPSTTAEFFSRRVLPEPLVPTVPDPGKSDNSALADCLQSFETRTRIDDFSSLESFIAANRKSPWRLAVLTNLGLLQYRAGYFSQCIGSFRAAWEEGKDATSLKPKALADRAAGEYTKMLARLGRYEDLKAFLAEVQGRQFIGQATELMMAGKEGSTTMEKRPEISFRCGPMALSRILASQGSPLWASPEILQSKSGIGGMSLAEVAGISVKLGMNYQPAKRSPGASFILPSVIHWKVGHYAALVQEEDGRYLSQDPTFENETRHTLEALESEASGYFLVPPGPLPEGWAAIGSEEAATVFGKGFTTGPDPSPSPIEPTTTPPPPPGEPPCGGMASYTFRAMINSLQITDSPVGYSPPYGAPIYFTATYLQRDPDQPSNFTYSNLGPKWNFNWQQYVTDDPVLVSAAVSQYSGGNRVTHPRAGPSGGGGGAGRGGFVAAPQLDTRKRLSRPPSIIPYEVENPDGSKDRFGQPDGSRVAPRKVFLTQHIDPAGNTTNLSYDSKNRLTTITDSLGQKTTLSYELADDPYKITKVTDPFGRFASFFYDGQGRLTKIRDVIGIESVFTYDGGGDFINSLATPYGTTTFTTQGDGNIRRLTATDPAGDTEVLELDGNGTTRIIPDTEPLAPQGPFTNIWLHFRNSFHWNKKQWRERPNDTSHAHLYHWLHGANLTQVSPILESEKMPLQSRVWYLYPGQYQNNVAGTQSTPNVIGRAVEGGSQLIRRELNTLGKTTFEIDPVGRKTFYSYAANEIDLTGVKKSIGDTVFLNSGAGSVGPFAADTGASGGGTTSTTHAIDRSGITEAAPEAVYQSARAGDDFIYSFPNLQGGTSYKVRLHFAEISFDAAAKRLFDVQVNGKTMISNLDVFVAAGREQYKALVREFTVKPDVTGKIDIRFLAKVDFAFVSGIELVGQAGLPSLASYTWNASHRPLTYTDAAGQKTSYTWNTVGQLTAVTNAKKEKTIFTYYPADATGKQRKGRLSQINGPLAAGDIVSFDYDAVGNVASVTGPDGYFLRFAYDALDRVTRVTFPDDTYTETTYLALDPQTSRDRLGRITTYAYNSIRQLESVIDPLGRTIGYRWCKCGALSQLIDALGRVTKWKHDTAGRVTAKVYADGSTVNYAYQPLSGRLASITDEKGQVKTRNYYLDNSLAGLTYTNAQHSTPNVTFTYDPDFRRLKTMLDGIGTTTYRYYPIATSTLGAGRLASVDSPLPDDTLTYTYDELGRKTGYAINGVGETRTFDSLGRLATALNPLGLFKYNYIGATGRMDTVTYPNKMTCQYRYYPLSGDYRLKDIVHTLGDTNHTQLSRHSYEYNLLGNITRWTQISPQAGLNRSWLCGYDAADQLTSVTSQDPDTLAALSTGQYGYTYDLAGNRITETIDGVTTTGKPNALNQITSLTTAGASALPLQTYEWDAEDRLSAINSIGTNNRTEFEYDGFGRRLGVRAKQGVAVTSYRRFTWRGLHMAEERDMTGVSVQKRYFIRGMQTSGSGVNLDARLFVRDHLDSVRELVSSALSLSSAYDFDPFGRRSLSLSPTDESSLGFTGHWFHAGSSLTMAPFRIYNHELGRWISRDLLEEAGGINLYSYVENDPLNWVDPFGLEGAPFGADWADWWADTWIIESDFADVGVGFLDGFIPGAASWVYEQAGIWDPSRECSDAYRNGRVAGEIFFIAENLGRSGWAGWRLSSIRRSPVNGRYYGGRQGAWGSKQANKWLRDLVRPISNL